MPEPLHQDTLHRLGIDVGTEAAVVQAHHRARPRACTSAWPARTNWRGKPLHELWLKDTGGNLIEIYARPSAEARAEMPEDVEPVVLAGVG